MTAKSPTDPITAARRTGPELLSMLTLLALGLGAAGLATGGVALLLGHPQVAIPLQRGGGAGAWRRGHRRPG